MADGDPRRAGRDEHRFSVGVRALAAGDGSVDVALVALRPAEILDVLKRLLGRATAFRLHDAEQLTVDVGRHAFFVAADEDLRSFLEPGPDVPPLRLHSVLDV